MTSTPDFYPFAAKMEAEHLPELAVRTFQFYYEQLHAGYTGLIPESALEPVGSLPDADQLGEELAAVGTAALPHTVVLKLNGGLGTSMGLEKAKSLLVVKEGLTFLDIIARQALHSGVPLLLMNSFNTREDTLHALQAYPALWGDLPLDFLQHKVPKIRQDDYSAVSYPADPQLEWNPPGHGDIYTALITSGMLAKLRQAGIRYAFVSNADNLGAVLDRRILGYFAQNDLPFMMETADRTPADRKGGHLAQLPNGQLILRESAQCPEEDSEVFQDIGRHKYFNTNNLWINLDALHELLTAHQNVLPLPMIRNSKTVDPRDPQSTPIYQIETAMGSAVGIFPRAGAIRVPRHRFAPVKTTGDLLAVRSDAYVLTDDWQVMSNPARTLPNPVVVSLDNRFYTLIDEMEARFPDGPPSLVGCELLTVQGDITFGRGVALHGAVALNSDEPMMYAG
ncbi:MAG: UTP--glucose-1-phosphate uridylyltransferase [Chloroflexi bacterium]|nr:UTP--glucose-1-phosphate uridylyltransferase [Chloroflexota bacterium]